MQSTRYSYEIFMKLEFSRRIFEKYSNTKFNKNAFIGSRVVPYGQTDRHTNGRTDIQDEDNGRFSQLCEKPKNRLSAVCVAICNPITGLHRPTGHQDVESPRFQDNWHLKVVKLLALHTGRLYPSGDIYGTHFS